MSPEKFQVGAPYRRWFEIPEGFSLIIVSQSSPDKKINSEHAKATPYLG